MLTESAKNKLFIQVVDLVANEPETVEIIMRAVQAGITERLRTERKASADLAAGIVTMVANEKNSVRKNLQYMHPALVASLRHYKTAPIGKKIEELINECGNNKE